MRLQPTDTASVRTKNKLREHTDLNVIRVAIVVAFDLRGSKATLVRCNDCKWLGWLPSDEVKSA